MLDAVVYVSILILIVVDNDRYSLVFKLFSVT